MLKLLLLIGVLLGLAAAYVLERRAGLVVGVFGGLLYAALILAEWTQVIRPVEFPNVPAFHDESHASRREGK